MSLLSRLGSVLRVAARDPAVRRRARDLGRAAVRTVRHGSGSGDRGTAAGPRRRGSLADGQEHALADRRSEPSLRRPQRRSLSEASLVPCNAVPNCGPQLKRQPKPKLAQA